MHPVLSMLLLQFILKIHDFILCPRGIHLDLLSCHIICFIALFSIGGLDCHIYQCHDNNICQLKILWASFGAQLVKWDQLSFATGIGPAAEDLLGTGLESYMKQTQRVEELFGKIWPPPNV